MGAVMRDEFVSGTGPINAEPTVERTTVRATGMPHLEIFRGTAHDGEIRVACLCSLGIDHSYADGMKYLGPVEPRR